MDIRWDTSVEAVKFPIRYDFFSTKNLLIMNANIYLYTIGRIAENWSNEINGGIITANDDVSLGDSPVMKFARIDYLDENDGIDKIEYTNNSDEIQTFCFSGNYIEEYGSPPSKLGQFNIYKWEVRGLGNLFDMRDNELNLNEPWNYTVGEDEIRNKNEFTPILF